MTIKDIARLAGVSCSTVSRVLNDVPNVSAETRAQVLALCRQEGFQINRLARSLISSRTGLIGLIIPNMDSPVFFELALHVELYAREQGYHVMLCTGNPGDNKIEEALQFLIGRRMDGVLLASTSNDAQPLLHKYSQRIPTVLLGNCINNELGLPLNMVSVDNSLGGRLAAEHLHALGHSRILYCGLRSASISHQLRYQGFLLTAQHLGLSVQTLENNTASSSSEAGYQLAKRFFSQGYAETAVFAAADSIALGLMQAADEAGIAIPERLSLLSFDNIHYAALPGIQLTTFDQCQALQAQAAVDLLLSCINHPDQTHTTQRLFRPKLVARSSCQPL